MGRLWFTILLAFLTGLILMLLHLVRSWLKQHHAELFARLGNPAFNDSNLQGTYWTFQKFIWWGHFSEVSDKALHALCILACMSELSFGVAFFL
jgi:hypothetical protein